MSSSTNLVNGVLHTQNIINLGGNSGACSNSPTYCQDGYSLYVPCLKNITRGQKVCFQMYVADMSNQDTLDLNEMCGMTLQLSGAFGCNYGQYKYPDDITSLQDEDLVEVKCVNFAGDNVRVDLGYLEYGDNKVTEIDSVNDGNGMNVNVVGTYGDFYKGEIPYLSADDSDTHIFMGWTSSDRLSELCEGFNINDMIITNEHEWVWDEPVDHDITLYAIYRKRKTYTIKVDFENRHSYFLVTHQGKKTMLSDKQRDYATVVEGYHFVVKCVPLTTKDKEGTPYTYNFYKWPDGYLNQSREYVANDELFKNGEMLLFAICGDEKIEASKSMNSSSMMTPTDDDFGVNIPEENILGYKSMEYISDNEDVECSDVNQVYDPENELMKSYISLTPISNISFDSGVSGSLNLVLSIDKSNLTFNDMDEDGNEEPIGNIIVKNDDNTFSYNLTSDCGNEITIELGKCESGVVEMYTTLDEIHIGGMCMYEKVITNKGLIELCLSPEDTAKLYRGILNASGAICVNDDWYGIDMVQLGTVNKLAPINIIEQ